jgi:ABC-type transport system involved in cytochrome bd biosynthesis fused ATPase/permease subunit
VPLSPDNPNRDRNFVALILGGVILFAVIMGSYVALSFADKDTDAFTRFLTLLLVTLIPSSLSAWQAVKARQSSQVAAEASEALRADVHNGVFKDKVKEGVAEVLNPKAGTITYSGGTDTAQSTQESTEEGRDGRPSV